MKGRMIGVVSREEALDRINHLIGTMYVGTVKGYISELTQLGRIVGPNDGTSKEMDPRRLHIRADEEGIITKFYLG